MDESVDESSDKSSCARPEMDAVNGDEKTNSSSLAKPSAWVALASSTGVSAGIGGEKGCGASLIIMPKKA
jgi:hypothetical protein